jgi:hypothetical protein
LYAPWSHARLRRGAPSAVDGGPSGIDGGPSAVDGGLSRPPPGDRFFDGAGTTIGAPSVGDGGTSTSFRIVIAIFDPAYAANHPAGTPGSNSSIQAAAGRIDFLGSQPIELTGTWNNDGTVTLQGGGLTFTGTISGATITGSFSGSSSGVFAGADVTVGQVAVFIGTQDDGSAFDLVVSKNGVVTGVVGGTSGGTIDGTASGNSFSYSWQANGATGSGTGSVGTSGSITGASTTNGCMSSWGCMPGPGPVGLSASDGCHCVNGCYQANCDAGACAGFTCCIAYNLNGAAGNTGPQCQCLSDTYLAQSGQTCAGAAMYPGYQIVPSCLQWNGGGTACGHAFQASPAPCPKSAGGACLGFDFANLAGTCAGGNLAACTPPPGGCSCPANGGCNTCGKISACCVP